MCHVKGYLSVLSERHGVMRAARHLPHFLVLRVGGDQQRRQSLVGVPVPQLTVAVVSPCKQLSVCNTQTQRVTIRIRIPL